jgi:phosphoglycolate phosphatase
MLKAAILDYNGLLVDDLDIHEESYMHVAGELGLPLKRETIRKYISYSPSQKRIFYFGDIPDETWQRINELKSRYYFEQVEKRDVVFPEVEVALSALASKYILALISNSSREYFERVFPRYLAGLFAEIVFPDEVGRPKPSPDSLLDMTQRLGIAADECCYVGDSILDVQMAKSAGIRVIAVATGDNSEDELREAGANWVLKSLSELSEKLEDL